MEPLLIQATKSTPLIRFDAASNQLEIKGDCYPENAAKFYDPLFTWLEEYLGQLSGASVQLVVAITYFNSSSSKLLMDLFEILEEAAEGGHDIHVQWRYHEDDDMALEYGEEFQEDLHAIHFTLEGFTD